MYIANIAEADQPERMHDLSTLWQVFLKTRATKQACLISRISVYCLNKPRLRGFTVLCLRVNLVPSLVFWDGLLLRYEDLCRYIPIL